MRIMIRERRIRVMVLQRESLVAPGVPSLSVSARIVEVLDYLAWQGVLEYVSISEMSPCAEKGVLWADVIILSKHNSSHALMLAQFARNRGVKIVYDIDDWIFSFPKYSGGRSRGGQNFSRALIDLADVITVANEELYRRVPHVINGNRLVLLPNGMWVERYTEVEKAWQNDFSALRVLFTNADFLKVQNAKDEILTAIQVFFSRHRDYVLDFFGDPFPEMFSLPFLHFTNRMSYVEYIRSIIAGSYQFAIVPLGAEEDEDSSDFNSCKNPFKYINYGAAKIPGVYSYAYIYRKCIRDRETGLLVRNTFESWLDALETMASDSSLRQSIRTAAYMDVINNFHVRKSASILNKIIEDLVSR